MLLDRHLKIQKPMLEAGTLNETCRLYLLMRPYIDFGDAVVQAGLHLPNEAENNEEKRSSMALFIITNQSSQAMSLNLLWFHPGHLYFLLILRIGPHSPNPVDLVLLNVFDGNLLLCGRVVYDLEEDDLIDGIRYSAKLYSCSARP